MSIEEIREYIKINLLTKNETLNQAAIRWGKLAPIINEVNDTIKHNISINEKLYLIYHDLERPKCHCGEWAIFFKFSRGYSKYCSNKCAQLDPEIKEKKRKTSIANWGTDNPNRLEEVKNKIKKTNQAKYGVESHNQSIVVKEKKKNSYMKNYGVESPLQNKIIYDKVEQTKLKKYGEKNPFSFGSNLFNNIIKEKYGVNNISQFREIKNKKIKSTLDKTYQKLLNDENFKILNKREEFVGTMNRSYRWECLRCGKEFESYKTYRRCSRCQPYLKPTSDKEKEIIDFIYSLDKTFDSNTKQIITPLELDLYSENRKIAIEFNGLYWHSELNGKDSQYHLLKTKLCEEKGIHLIHIFEDEWDSHKELIKNMIKRKIGIIDSEKIRASKTTIKEIDAKVKNEFLDKYHIQGEDKSSIKLGAFYQDELIGVMTFSRPRLSLGQKKRREGVFELSRFATNYDYTIYGLGSKFIKYFKKNYKWTEIYSYADRRWSHGKLYIALGFEFNSFTPPSYWYIIDKNREHRFKYRKSELKKKLKTFDESLSEWENMKMNGYDRIWDCGHYKYILLND